MKKIAVSLLLGLSVSSMAGTLMFKDGYSLSKVKIISISNGRITIEKDKGRKFYRLNSIKSYYSTDVNLSNTSDPNDYAKYKVTVFNIKAPEKGLNSKKKPTEFTFGYNISRSKSSSKKIRAPYFYLYILTRGKDEYSHRRIYKYYKPKMAKPKGKGYDEAAILAKVNDFKRPIWHADRKNLHGGITGRQVKFSLKGVKNRKVLAWRLEVWGDSGLVYQKDEVQYQDLKVGKKWWSRIRD